MIIGQDIDMDKNRFTTIENQLYNIYRIFGNGVLAVYDASGAQVSSWNLLSVPGEQAVQITSGRGHINYKYAESNASVKLTLTLPPNITSGTFNYYFYAKGTTKTATQKAVSFIYSDTQIEDPVNYIGLGMAEMIVGTDGSYVINVYNDAAHGRQEISLLGSLSGLVKDHVHKGGLNDPSPIDLSKHVTGFLSSDNIDNLDLGKVTKGTLDANRLPQIDHNSLTNIGTLTHAQIDALLAALQYPDNNYKLSDYGIINRLQIILALKKQQGFFNIDGEQINSIFYMPYTQLDNFVDYTLSRTTATVNNEIHRVYGTTGVARQSNVVKVNTTQDFQTALFFAQDSVKTPQTSNVEVAGITTISAAGSMNLPYGITGSANTIYVSSVQDSFITSFSTTGVYINRRIDFDSNLNLDSPYALNYDSVKNYLYITDTFNHRIIVTNPDFSSVIAKIGFSNASGQPGNGFGNGFNYPKGIYGFGNTFYVADSGNNQIQKYTWSAGVPVYQTSYYYNKINDNNISGIYQGLSDPRGLFATNYGGDNYLIVSDYNNHRVLCGVETSGVYSVYQVIGNNSAGVGIFNTSLISFDEANNVTGVGAGFTFYTSLNGTLQRIGIANSGANYRDRDRFVLSYNGQEQGYFNVLTDGVGRISTAYVTYGFSTTAISGFSHPQGIAVSLAGSKISLLISDTDNNRVLKSEARTGVGTTSREFVNKFSFGTSGTDADTSLQAYFNRPAHIYAQQGFGTIFVSDNLNNRVHGLVTDFSSSTFVGFTTSYTFGESDPDLNDGGIRLIQPEAYIGLSNTTVVGSGYSYGDVITQSPGGVQATNTDRYSYITFASPVNLYQNDILSSMIAVCIKTLNESGIDKTLGRIESFLIYDNTYRSPENTVSFTVPSGVSLKISNLYTIRPKLDTTTEVNTFVALSNYTTNPNPVIIGFGFRWNTADDWGWTNNDDYGLTWYLPKFDTNLLRANYPKILSYRQKYGYNHSIFAFNSDKYVAKGTFVFRFDTGAGSDCIFNSCVFNFSTPVSTNGYPTDIAFSYRVSDTLEDIYTARQYSVYPESGGTIDINKSGRYIDLLFNLYASAPDAFASPSLSSILLFYSVSGKTTGIIYDTNVSLPPAGTYSRLRWSQGTITNIDVVETANSGNQEYELRISDTSGIGQYVYLSHNNLNIGADENYVGFIDINNGLYLSPYQAFAGLERGLLNAQHYISNKNNGYFIADTDNDRILEVDENGQFLRAVQGNIRLPRCNRAFAVLGAFYNSNLKQLYVVFSQYVVFAQNYLTQLSITINGISYGLSNSAYFSQNNVGLFNPNSNNKSAVFFINATDIMNALFVKYPDSAKLQIQNPANNQPFQVPTTGRSDGNSPENETFTYSTTMFDEFQVNSAAGIGTILGYNSNVGIAVTDATTFGDSNESSNLMWSYCQGDNEVPIYSTRYSIPVQVKLVYFDNIFKPINVDYTDASALVVAMVGNNSVRAYDAGFNLLYKINPSLFTFNEKLGGSVQVLDRASTEQGNTLLIAQPGIGSTNITGNVFIYNRNTASVINQFSFNNYDAVKALSDESSILVLLNDRIGKIKSKLLRLNQDGTVSYNLSNVFTRPVSLDIKENGYYYVTDITGQYGTIFNRTFVGDGSGSSSGSNQSGGGTTGGGTTGGGSQGGGGLGRGGGGGQVVG